MRKFRCISREENAVNFWLDSFILGGIYKEVGLYDKPNILELFDKDGDVMFVDADCFEEVSEVEQLVELYTNLSDEDRDLFNRIIIKI